MRKITLGCCTLLVALVGSSASAQLYTENFDDGNASNRWTANAGKGFESVNLDPVPMDTNFDTLPFTGVDGVNDDFSGFAFDYSAAGIPSAPHSTGGSTIGLKLQASLFSNALGGFSASPNGLNLTGDYSVKFDAWSSTLGGSVGFPSAGSGSTNLSTFGILTSGTFSQTILSSDGVFFAYTGDGGSGSDYRAYSAEDTNSYDGTDGEPNATYFADGGSRNGTAQLYKDAVGDPVTAPQSVKDAFPSQNLDGNLNDGSTAFAWQENEIRKEGDIVDWYVNGYKLISVDTSSFTDQLGGGNLSFGHADINFSSSTDFDAPDLLFTLIDNIEVTAITPAADNADFDSSGLVDGEDFLTWQQNVGTPDAQLVDGDANGDMAVDAADLAIFQTQYGSAPPAAAAIASVPEPSTWMALAVAVCLCLCFARPRAALCRVRVQ